MRVQTLFAACASLHHPSYALGILDIRCRMLMLAEAASIPVAEVPIGWHEVQGSKLNVLWDSLGMAWGLFVLRAAWAMGVYSRT